MKNFTILLVCFCLFAVVPAIKAADSEPGVKTATVADDSATTALNAAVAEFNTLSKKEKKSRFREVKKLLRDYKAEKKAGMADETSSSLILLAILAILVPPLAVYLKERTLTWKFWATAALLVTGIIFLSALPYLWILAAGLALLVVFDVL